MVAGVGLVGVSMLGKIAHELTHYVKLLKDNNWGQMQPPSSVGYMATATTFFRDWSVR